MDKLVSKDKAVLANISSRRFNRTLYGKAKKKAERRRAAEYNYAAKKQRLSELTNEFGKDFTYREILEKWLPTNLLYIIKNQEGGLNINALSKEKIFKQAKPIILNKVLYIPEWFSIIDKPRESFEFLKLSVLTLLFGKYETVYFSYKYCRKLDIGAQVVLDIIKKESIFFINKCRSTKGLVGKVRAAKFVGIADVGYATIDIQKILASVGSLAVHANVKLEFPDIIPYKLCIHNRDEKFNRVKAIKQKEIDTTKLADYVIDSLSRLNKTLSGEKIDDLCTIIGEILINAEEHSTTHHRFSIGYFQESLTNGKHIGVFRLVILNFGKTIYEKFASTSTPNLPIVARMKKLSEKYTKDKLFFGKEFEEENLWTLYALQEGVTSIPDKNRGNGSIQFIDSFFSIKGEDDMFGEKSRMTILSGNTQIVFDGTYRIEEKTSDGQKFKVMTFNDSGNIEDAPDKKYVKYVENYFPGTLISAKIFLNEDDFVENANQQKHN